MASKVCLEPGCPTIGAWRRGRCPTHDRARDKARGTKTERGYGAAVLDTPLGRMTFDQCRRAYQSRMDAGLSYRCACGCGEWVSGTGWHLMHHPSDRTVVVGPGLAGCNLAEAGRNSHMS